MTCGQLRIYLGAAPEAEAMGGSLTPETTPGGGLTMVLALPAATAPIAESTARAG